MKKRTFIKTVVGGSLAVAAGTPWMGCNTPSEKPASKNTEVTSVKKFSTPKPLPNRWVWLRPSLEWKEDDWKKSFERLKKAGFEGILPQVYASRETLFDHPILPVKERWLEGIIPLAHSFDLEVHAWMWTMPLNEKSMVEKHPDWFSVNRNGNPSNTHPAYVDYYKFMCPCHPEVQEFVAGNVEALAKIEDLDGVHLDYVRQPDVILAEALQPKYNIVQDKEYPQYDYPYSQNCRNLFKEKHGIDPMDLGEEAPANKAWRQFRYNAVSNVVNSFCVPMAKKYNKPITAAVFPNWESVRQQWHRWDLDGFLPMLYQGFYNEDIEWIGKEVEKALGRLKGVENPKPVYSGLFMQHIPAEEMEKAVKIVKDAGAKGFCLFSLNAISEAHWKILEKLG
ncbi:MAG: family 10 glycosylhydrolase [Bacteroidota bacterium]